MSSIIKPEDVVPVHFPDTLEGWVAAWIIRGVARERSIPCDFSWGGQAIAPLDNRNVIILEAAPAAEYIQDAAGPYRSQLAFARAQSAAAMNGTAGAAIPVGSWERTFPFGVETFVADGKVAAVHDPIRSLPGQVWDFFRGVAVMPRLVADVDAEITSELSMADRADLVEALESYALNFKTIDLLVDACQDTRKREMLLVGGQAIRRFREKNGLM